MLRGGRRGGLLSRGGGDLKEHQEIHKLHPFFFPLLFFFYTQWSRCVRTPVRARWSAPRVTNPRRRLQWVTECGGWSLRVSHMPPDSAAIRETRKHASDTQTQNTRHGATSVRMAPHATVSLASWAPGGGTNFFEVFFFDYYFCVAWQISSSFLPFHSFDVHQESSELSPLISTWCQADKTHRNLRSYF